MTRAETAPLFTAAEAWEGDPLLPGLEDPTPWEIVASLTKPEREQRVRYLMDQAHEIYAESLKLADDKPVMASVLLFSGGNDSTVLGHLFKDVATHAGHANTTIGIEDTRQFVRDTCKAWNLPLLERTPPLSYRDLVLDQGFPGPGMHFKMYQRLKLRVVEQIQREFITNGRRQRVVFIAGRRRAESARRKDIPLYERNRSAIWASPIAMWTKLDMTTYRLMMGDVPTNVVSDLVGMSGECLCGAYAKPGEKEMIRVNYPDVIAEIEALEVEVRAAGHPEQYCQWGHGMASRPQPGVPAPVGDAALAHKTGAMCTSCSIDTDPLWELIEHQAMKGG